MPTPLIAPPSWLKPDDPDYNLLVYGQKDSRQEDPVKAAEDFLAQPDVTTNGQQTNAQTADQYLADHGLTMPQVGERRSGPTETVEWDGSRWNPIAQTSAEAGYHPGLNTSPTEAMLQGFLSGASEGALSPQGKAAISGGAALLGPAGIPVAAGAEGLAALLGTHYGVSDAPQSFGEAAADVAEPTASTALFGAAIPAGLKYAATLPKTVTGAGGALYGGYKGYKYGGIPGAIEGAVLGGTTGTAMPRLLRAIGGLAGGAAEADNVAVRPAGTKAQTLNDVLDGILNDYRQEPAETPYTRNTNPTPDVRSIDRGNLATPPAPEPPVSPLPHADSAESDNILHNMPFGEGRAMPTPILPTELRNAALDGLNAPGNPDSLGFDTDYKNLTGQNSLPRANVVETAATPQVSPTHADVNSLIDAMGSANTPAASQLSDVDTHEGEPASLGQWFDRGSFDSGAQAAPMKGEEGYTYNPESANLRADPQTAIDDLLQARRDAINRGDLTTARQYAKDISQRNKIALSLKGYGRPFNKGISVLKVKWPASVSALTPPDIPF